MRSANVYRSSLLALSLSLGLLACGDSGFPAPGEVPTAPAQNDSSYVISGLRQWSIVGNEVDPGNDNMDVTIQAPEGIHYVDAWLNGGEGIRFFTTGTSFTATLDLSTLAPGDHQILFAAEGSDTAFAQHSFKRSHPLYVVVTTDWDDADTSDIALSLQDDLHDEHPELLLTHFVGPYTFTDPEVSQERQDLLVAWLKGMRDNYQDEIGLHIHPYCNFVDQVGTILSIEDIPCNSQPSTVYSDDPTGYTVQVSSYDDEQFKNLLLASDKLFEANGLGKPTSFRAGGWTAEINTIRSLAAAGYVADTSALNWERLDEWNAPRMGTLYAWNKEHWSSIGDTSQPYYPSVDDVLVPGADSINVLEVPDNGILVDYVSTQEMIDIFEANWDGEYLEGPVNYSIGFHPSNFNAQYKQTIGAALTHVDGFLASKDQGPVVYGRLSDMPKIWKRN